MTKGDLLNAFIKQVTMMWGEEEMEQEAGFEDTLVLLQQATMLGRAFLTMLPTGEGDK